MSDAHVQYHLSADGTVWYGVEPIYEFTSRGVPIKPGDRPEPKGRPRYDADGLIIEDPPASAD